MVLGPNPTDHPRTLILEELLPPHLAQQAIALAATIMAATATAPVVEVEVEEEEAAEVAAAGAEEAEVVAVGVEGVVVVADAKSCSLENSLTDFHHNSHMCLLVSQSQGRVCD